MIAYKRNLSPEAPEAPKALAEGTRHVVNAPKALAEGVHHKMVAVPHKKSHNGSGSAEGTPQNSKGRLRRALSAQAFSLGFQPGPPGRHLLAVQLLPPGVTRVVCFVFWVAFGFSPLSLTPPQKNQAGRSCMQTQERLKI